MVVLLWSSLIPKRIVGSAVSVSGPAGTSTLKVGKVTLVGSFPVVNLTVGPFVVLLPVIVWEWIEYCLLG